VKWFKSLHVRRIEFVVKKHVCKESISDPFSVGPEMGNIPFDQIRKLY
jgi:hypothetical protein